MLWSIFERVRAALKQKNLITWAELFTRLAAHFAKDKRVPFDFAIVDEAQDLSVAQLRFSRRLGVIARIRFYLQAIWDSVFSAAIFVAGARRERSWPFAYVEDQLSNLTPDTNAS